MAKIIKIPDDVTRLEIDINGKHYSYQGGITVSVPDEVAALLESNTVDRPTDTRPVHAPLAAERKKDGKAGVPVLTDPQGNLYADSEGVAAAALGEIYVEGHKAIIPQAEE